MSIRRFVFGMVAALLVGATPGMAAGVSSSVVLTITSPGTIYFGQGVDGYVSVTASDGSTPSGTINFLDGGQSICVIPATQAASCPASTGAGFVVGTHVLTAVYSGDASHLGSTSNAVTVMVLANGTSVSLASSGNPVAVGQSVMLTATVQDANVIPTGTVTFLDGGAVLGMAALNAAGAAVLSTSGLSVGNHAVTASYGGDASAVASVSPVLNETVDSASISGQDPFSITVTGSTTVGVGRMTNLLVTVTPRQGFAEPVELSCGSLPWEAACTFGMRTIPAGGGTTTLEVSTFAPHDCGSSTPYFSGLPFAGPMVAGLMMLFVPGKRRRGWKGLLIALVA
ncbi:MAG: Ig-like domain-containing protein, partial [Edaphobacter sp.]